MARKLKVLEQMVAGNCQVPEMSMSKRNMLKRYGSADNGDFKDIKGFPAELTTKEESDFKLLESKVNETRLNRPLKGGKTQHNLSLGTFCK